MKIHLGKKRGEDQLRPLTEQEIQERLYGRYLGAGEVKEKLDIEFLPPGGKERPFFFGSGRRPPLSFPWREWLLSGQRRGEAVWNGLKSLLDRTGRGVGMGLLVLGTLFVAVHTLNTYRGKAIQEQKTRPRGESPESPLKRPEVVPSLVAKTVIAPPPPPVENTVAPGPERGYAVQICTYAREEDAGRLVRAIQEAQFPAFVQPMERTNGKTFYPVFIGRFQTYQEAQKQLQEFRSKPISNDFPDSFVRTI